MVESVIQIKDKCQCKCKKHHICEKCLIWNPSKFSCESRKNSPSISYDSVIMCDVVAESYDKQKTNVIRDFNEKNKM